MLFEIHASKPTGESAVFMYDNMTNTLTNQADPTITYQYDVLESQEGWSESLPFDKHTPLRKSKQITNLKIQLGLSCNYSCSYCSQKFVERAPETNKRQIDQFLAKLDVLELSSQQGLNIEFWGGEPFVYWKTMKPLAEAIRDKYKHWENPPRFHIITNGSLLTEEICDWLSMMNFNVGISHDGPGQKVRGPDPFDDPETKRVILGFYRAMRRLGKPISFNCMINRDNQSRKQVYEWFVQLTGDPNVQIGEGAFIDAYDEDGIRSSLQTLNEHFDYRQRTFGEIYAASGNIAFQGTIQKVQNFIHGILNHSEAKYVGQRCGMDDERTIAVDLRGNIVTCQNVSAVHTSHNGQPHLGGNLDDYDNVALRSSTHWSKRLECSGCPVLHLCRGSCMYTDGKYWEVTCNNAYSDNLPLFALAVHSITGYIPTLIKADGLPPERQDVFGTVLGLEDRILYTPGKVVSEKNMVVEGVEVYGKSRLVTEA